MSCERSYGAGLVGSGARNSSRDLHDDATQLVRSKSTKYVKRGVRLEIVACETVCTHLVSSEVYTLWRKRQRTRQTSRYSPTEVALQIQPSRTV